MASEIPVDPTVPSKMVDPFPGVKICSFSAVLIMLKATLSFVLPPGLRNYEQKRYQREDVKLYGIMMFLTR